MFQSVGVFFYTAETGKIHDNHGTSSKLKLNNLLNLYTSATNVFILKHI
jgi:hypothetical protein